ncbi:GH92 family glycosyl hydrolase [Luteolibacter marinus]|uniref:GH92 family glycosyl hydrolase n=1 Tax=Luteolibacter marinus TaxID=2776705 RepID=UPI0018670109|nr:GH92 family glycosyl hydrolase [Luteolibacter marinus]
MKRLLLLLALGSLSTGAETRLVDRVDPFLGTAPLTKVEDIGFKPPWRVWAGLTFPGASMPNGMVQLSPITKFGSGAGYEYEDDTIQAFAHTNKGHWNLCYIPIMPVAGEVDPDDFSSTFSHDQESASPGYYQVLLKRHGINAEFTTTLRGGIHRYTFPEKAAKKLVVDLAVSNERVRDWKIDQDGDHAFKGFQNAHEKVYFHAVANHKITAIRSLNPKGRRSISVVDFEDAGEPLEIRIGLSFVSTENAKLNLEKELDGKDFAGVRKEASDTWETLLSKIRVEGGTDKQQGMFYSCLYRSFLWPVLRSDVNGEFTNQNRQVVRKDFRYYTTPSLWDDYRNKLVLLGTLEPEVTNDVIQSMIDVGQCSGFMPTFFHGDHAAPFISGSYLRGLRGYDVKSAYELLLKNATVESRRARPHLDEYIAKGYVSTPPVEHPRVETKAKAGVTKTLEYAYDDYAVALMAGELGDEANRELFMKRSRNFRNVFDAETGLMRGRLEDGGWVTPFDPKFPYYEYMYREANAWQSTFFAPHDTEGLIALYKGKDDFEAQLDRLFTLPWEPDHIAMNINSFIGQYCHGNQPDHSFPWLYHFIGKPEKSQAILDEIMERFYGMDGGKTLCGMDDAGEMSAWYVYAAIGLYPYSPADDDYIVSAPLFDRVQLRMNPESTLTIRREGKGRKLGGIDYDGEKIDGYFVDHAELARGKELVIRTEAAPE